MYVRFLSPMRSRMRGVDYGIFQCAIKCRDDYRNPEYLRSAIREEINWYNDNLPAPREGAFDVKSRKRMINVGICWFMSDADEMVRRAYALRALLAECGYAIVKKGTKQPGQILYRDNYQIVAKPFESTPTLWG